MGEAYACVQPTCPERLRGLSDAPGFCSVCHNTLTPMEAGEDVALYAERVRELEARVAALTEERDEARVRLGVFRDIADETIRDGRDAPWFRSLLAKRLSDLGPEYEVQAFLRVMREHDEAERRAARAEAALAEARKKPEYICLDCGAVGHRGGYHDHGNGNAGDTASIADVLAQLRRGGEALDLLAEARQALELFANLADVADEFGHSPGSTCLWRLSYDDLDRARSVLASSGPGDGEG